MLAVRLVRLIEKNIGPLSHDLSEIVWKSPQCSDLSKVPATELEARTREIYRNLSDWLLDKTESQIERRYTELGAARAAQGERYAAELRRAVIGEGLLDFRARVHDEGAVLHHRLADGFARHADEARAVAAGAG